MPELLQETKKLISDYQFWKKSLEPKEGVSVIHVDEFASRVAGFYEKIREIVDWKEEHLIRRSAIIRKLKRRFIDWDLTKLPKTEEMAEPLVLELIRGGHFFNDKIEEVKIKDVQRVINKYIFILNNLPKIHPVKSSSAESGAGPADKREFNWVKNKKGELQFYNWLLEIAACEIEETITPALKERALINYMFSLMKERIKISEGIIVKKGIGEEEKNIQIYIAIQQALFKLDHPIISYNLLKYKYSQWNTPDPEWLSRIVKNIYQIWQGIENDLSYSLAGKFYGVCEKYDTPYLLLGDILSEENLQDISERFSNPENLEGLIKKAYNKRLLTLKRRLLRAAFYSTLSIFVANIFSIIIVEIPLAKLITGSFSGFAIFVDIFVPTFLMLLLTITTKPPSKKNLNAVLLEAMKIVYKKEKTDIYEIKLPRKKGPITLFFISIFYALGAFFTLGVIFLIFRVANLPPTSIFIHILLVALVAFAGLAIRRKAEELTIEETAGGFLGFIFDILLLPVAGFGRWLANKWKKYNAVAAFFNALIDMPFLTFVEFLEKWRYYIKERKEEIH